MHQLVLGSQPSVLDQFEPEKERARSTADRAALLKEYRAVKEEVRQMEKDKTASQVGNLQIEQPEAYRRESALRSELQERERKAREMRDTLIFCG